LSIFQLTALERAEMVRPVFMPFRAFKSRCAVKTAKAYSGGVLSLRSLPESKLGIHLTSVKAPGEI
jgi:hypothetical protein